jgi:hypothetical protein
MKISVTVLVTSCKHGTEYDVFPDQDSAWAALYDYVCQFWGELGDEPMPENRQDAIEKYFEIKAYDEWWEIATRTLDLSGSDLRSLTLNEEDIR